MEKLAREFSSTTAVSCSGCHQILTIEDINHGGIYCKYCRRERYLSGERVEKRKYPRDEKCELCGKKENKRLVYHHWDDKNKQNGIWVHNGDCHFICEVIDKITNKDDTWYKCALQYLDLKDKINSGYYISTI